MYEFEKRADELNRFGIDLFELAPITDLVQATYMAIGVPLEEPLDQLFEPGKVDWDWGAVLYALYEETNGENESFLQIAANLRKEYRKDLLNL